MSASKEAVAEIADASENVSSIPCRRIDGKPMTTQRKKLLEMLPLHGWKVVTADDELRGSTASDWFVDELWEVESAWSPRGVKVWVTFVVDPQTPNPLERKKGQGVYAVKAARRKPTGWGIEDDEVGLYLNSGWEDRLPEFFDQLSELRHRSQPSEMPGDEAGNNGIADISPPRSGN